MALVIQKTPRAGNWEAADDIHLAGSLHIFIPFLAISHPHYLCHGERERSTVLYSWNSIDTASCTC